MTKETTSLAQRVRQTLLETGLTQQEFAASLGISTERIKNLVQGRVARLHQSELEAISQKFGVSPLWLREGSAATEASAAESAKRSVDFATARSKTLVEAVVGRGSDGQILITLQSSPFNGREIQPHDLERLARNLLAIANMAKQHEGRQSSTLVVS
jgi:transcriptional regulator with XRE-family HTH domain